MNIIDIVEFYASPLGKATARVVGAALKTDSMNGKDNIGIGIGYAVPWLDPSSGYALMLAKQGVVKWPMENQASRSALVEPDSLPFADNSVEHVLIAHGLEFVDEPEAMLEEAWRVLAPLGTLNLLVANRRGLWAAIESTPFGHGQPFSHGQLVKLLTDTQFSIRNINPVLHGFPMQSLSTFKVPEILERIGQALPIHMAGAWLVAAQKQVPSYASTRKVRRRQALFRPHLLPAHQKNSQLAK